MNGGRAFVAIVHGPIIWSAYWSEPPPNQSRFGDSFLLKSDSLIEASGWWKSNSKSPIAILDANLAALPAKHLVVGHDPGDLAFPGDAAGDRKKGVMAMRYDRRLYLIDVGMSSAVGYSAGAWLHIERGVPDVITARYPDGSSTQL